MKIDFENFKIYTGIAHKEAVIVNVKKELAEGLYMKGNGLPCHALALKIYNAQGPVELSDSEQDLLMAFSERVFSPSFIDSLAETIGRTNLGTTEQTNKRNHE